MAGVFITGHYARKEFYPDDHVVLYDHTADVKHPRSQASEYSPSFLIEKYNSREMRKFSEEVKKTVKDQ